MGKEWNPFLLLFLFSVYHMGPDMQTHSSFLRSYNALTATEITLLPKQHSDFYCECSTLREVLAAASQTLPMCPSHLLLSCIVHNRVGQSMDLV